jgi:hypothetical protein
VVDTAGGGGQKYPLFEDLSSTYSTLNENLIDKPLEGGWSGKRERLLIIVS